MKATDSAELCNCILPEYVSPWL